MRYSLLGSISLSVLLTLSACGKADTVSEGTQEMTGRDAPAALTIAGREVDAEKGRELFIDKGCVICHSVNGVGGKAAPALDAPVGDPVIDPLDFAARIWFGAPAMFELQSIELGYKIYLTADDIGHLAAFSADREMQKKLTDDDIPDDLRDALLNEAFWEVESWKEFLANGQEGEEGEPVEPQE